MAAYYCAIIHLFTIVWLLRLGFKQNNKSNKSLWEKKRVDGYIYSINYFPEELRLDFPFFESPFHTKIIQDFLLDPLKSNQITPKTIFKADIILNYLIDQKVLPSKLYRLPRLSEKEAAASFISQY